MVKSEKEAAAILRLHLFGRGRVATRAALGHEGNPARNINTVGNSLDKR